MDVDATPLIRVLRDLDPQQRQALVETAIRLREDPTPAIRSVYRVWDCLAALATPAPRDYMIVLPDPPAPAGALLGSAGRRQRRHRFADEDVDIGGEG
jgi:hypothetical protein